MPPGHGHRLIQRSSLLRPSRADVPFPHPTQILALRLRSHASALLADTGFGNRSLGATYLASVTFCTARYGCWRFETISRILGGSRNLPISAEPRVRADRASILDPSDSE